MGRSQGSEADGFLLELLGKYGHLPADDIIEAAEVNTDLSTEAIRHALKNLADRGFIDVVQPGSGRRPAIYGIPDQLSPDAYDEAPLDGFPEDDEGSNSGYSWGDSEHGDDE